MSLIQFTRNHEDLSTERGFQFKFYCDKCHNGFLSRFVTSKVGLTSSVLQTVGNIFGGKIGRVGQTGYEIRKLVLGKEHDVAYESAVTETKPQFKNCSRCGNWVCHQGCWNDDRGLCEKCAPNLQEEKAAAEADADVREIREKAKPGSKSKAGCPSCGATANGGKFCGECGTSLEVAKVCSHCSTRNDSSFSFCSDCGEKL